jgi:site-specific recombinase XerD
MENNQIWHYLLRYLEYSKVIRNYAPQTIKSYKVTLKYFLKDTKLSHPKDLTRSNIESWFFKGRLDRHWSPSTFRTHFKYINCLCKWLVKEDILESNPCKEIEKPKLEHKLPRTLSKDEAKLVLDTTYHMRYDYKFQRHRNTALVAIMLYAGLRRGETMKLKLHDVKLYERTIYINQAKGNKDRLVPINTALNTILERYLKERDRLKKDSIYFFVGTNNNLPMGEKVFTRLMKQLRKKTKLDFSTHTLRHAFARLMLEGGCDIYTLSKLMGHSKITTTTIYLSCSTEQMSKSIEMHRLN